MRSLRERIDIRHALYVFGATLAIFGAVFIFVRAGTVSQTSADFPKGDFSGTTLDSSNNVILSYTTSHRSWGNSDVDISATSSNTVSRPVSDGAGGAIAAYMVPGGGGSGSNWKILAQRVDVNGTKQWGTNGVSVSSSTNQFYFPNLAADSGGGAFVAYTQFTGTYDQNLYVQKLNSSGVAQWTAGGVQISTTSVTTSGDPNGQIRVVADGSGGVFVFWSAQENPPLTFYRMHVQHLNSSGVAQLAPGGKRLSFVSYGAEYPEAISDGSGGAYVTWDEYQRVVVQHVNGSGTELWGAGGVVLASSSATVMTPRLDTDGSGGVIVAWQDSRAGGGLQDIYTQRVNSLGVAQWTANGVRLTQISNGQNPFVVTDGAGGAIIDYSYKPDARGYNVYVQRVDSNGNKLWGSDGTKAYNQYQHFAQGIVADGQGGAYTLAWNMGEQHLDSSGAITWTDFPNGIEPTNQVNQEGNLILSDATHTILIYDGFGFPHTFAEKLSRDTIYTYSSPGTYTGVFSASSTSDWTGHTLNVSATTPAGTAVGVETCVYNAPASPCPKGNWQPLSGNTIQSGVGDRLAYRLTLSSSDANATPIVTSVSADIPDTPVSGPQWTVQGKTPGGGHYWEAIAGSSDGSKWIAAENGGYVYTSTDGGLNWTERQEPNAESWEDAYMSSDGSLMYLLDSAGFLYRSADGGATWTVLSNAGKRSWWRIAGSSDGTKLVASLSRFNHGYLYTSQDSGATWTGQAALVNPFDNTGFIGWQDVTMSGDGQKIFALGNSTSTNYYTANGGTSWTSIPERIQNWYSVTMSSDGTRLYAADDSFGQGYIHYSTNNGQSWVQATTSGAAYWDRIRTSSNGAVVAGAAEDITSNGYVYFSVNSGANWTRANVPEGYWYALGMSSDGSKMLAGSNFLIAPPFTSPLYLSTNTGATWSAINAIPNSLSPISWSWFSLSSDATKIAAASYGDYIYTSPDGGSTWKRASSTINQWYSIAGSADGTKVAAVANGDYIYTSADSGATWTKQTGSGSNNWYSIAASADGTKLAAVANGDYVYTSTDSGLTWTQQGASGARNWSAITSSADGMKLAAATYNDDIFTSTDGGVTWTDQVGSGAIGWNSIDSSSDGQKLIAGESGGFADISTDGGVTWTQSTGMGREDWYAASVSGDGSRFAMAGYDDYGNGYIYISSNGGVSWQRQDSAGNRSYAAIKLSADGTKLVAMTSGSTDGVSLTATIAPSSPPSVTSSPASNISTSTATFNGFIASIGTGNPTERGFAYGSTNAYDSTTSENGSFGVGSFSLTLDPDTLLCSSTYHFGAYAINDGGLVYGSDQSFDTSQCTDVPTVSSAAASSITDTGATLNGSIDAEGDTTPSERGFAYGTTVAYDSTTTESGSFSAAPFSAPIAGLTCGTTYHFSAYATNDAGTRYGGDTTFATAACASSGGGGSPAPASNGAPSGSPVGRVDGPNTTRGFQSLLDGPTAVEAGTSATFTVTAKSLFGQSRTEGGDSVTIVFTGAIGGRFAAHDNGNGTYSFTIIPPAAGTSSVTAIINGELVRHDTVSPDDGRIPFSVRIAATAEPVASPQRPAPQPPVETKDTPAKHEGPAVKPQEKPVEKPQQAKPPAPTPAVVPPAPKRDSTPPAIPEPPKDPPREATSTDRGKKPEIAIDYGLTAACFPSFAWSGQQSVAKIYRTVGTGAGTKIATLNKKTQWFIDTAPVIGEDLTYRFEFPSQDTVTIVISAAQTNACRGTPATPVPVGGISGGTSGSDGGSLGSVPVIADIDGDGNDEQIVDGIVIDSDGSSAQVGTIDGNPVIDTDGDGTPDKVVRQDGSTERLVTSGGVLLLPGESLLTFYTPAQDARQFGVALSHDPSVSYVSYRVTASAYAAHDAPRVALSPKAQAVTAAAGSTGGVVLALLGASEVPLSFAGLWSILVHAWINLLETLSIRKRRKPWGVVYDSVSKLPIDPAYVELLDATGTVVKSAITDLEGRYGFLVEPGTYTIRASKTNYAFPSEKLVGMGRDLLYEDLYFGEPLALGLGAIAKNIPIDPVGVDWNQVEKKKQGLSSVGLNDRYAALAFDVFFYGGFFITGWQFLSHPTIPTAIVGALYSAIAFVQFWFGKPRLFGVVRDSSGSPLSFGIVKFSTQTGFVYATKVLDERGRYVALLTPGTYVMTIERRIDAEHTELAYRATVRARRGMVSASVNLSA